MVQMRRLESLHCVRQFTRYASMQPRRYIIEHQQRPTPPRYIDVDVNSIDRDKSKWPNAADFYFHLCDPLLHHIERIEVLGYAIPNVLNGISGNNNVICWSNQDDLTTSSSGHIYSVQLAPSTYNLNNILLELQTQMSSVVRQSDKVLHTWIVNGQVDTQLVQFISYKNVTLDQTPLSLTSGSPLVTVTQTDHGHQAGEIILLGNVTGFPGGLDPSAFNGEWPIAAVLDTNTFTIQITSIPYNTETSGGDLVTVGVRSKFKFIDTPNSILPTLGFTNESSSLPLTEIDPISCIWFTIDQVDILVPADETQSSTQVGLSLASTTFSIGHTLEKGDRLYLAEANTDRLPLVLVVNETSAVTSAGAVYVKCCVTLQDPAVLIGRNLLTEYLVLTSGTGAQVLDVQDLVTLRQIQVTDINDDNVSVSSSVYSKSSSLVTLTTGIMNLSVYRTVSTNYTKPGWGGSLIRLDCSKVGYAPLQNNLVNGVVYQEINLAGDPACFVTTPELEADTNYRSGAVERILLRVPLEQGAGNIIQSNTLGITDKTFFRHHLDRFGGLRLQIRTAANRLVAFKSLNWSISLRISLKS